MVERQLLDQPPAYSVGSAIAHMSNPGPLGQQYQRGGSRAHTLKVNVGTSPVVDQTVAVLERSGDGLFAGQLGEFVVGVGDGIDRKLRGEFAHGVRSHAVGYDKEMPSGAQVFGAGCRQAGIRILVVGSSHSNVAEAPNIGLVFPFHKVSTRIDMLGLGRPGRDQGPAAKLSQ